MMRYATGSILSFTPDVRGFTARPYDDAECPPYPVIGWAVVVQYSGAEDDEGEWQHETIVAPVVVADGHVLPWYAGSRDLESFPVVSGPHS